MRRTFDIKILPKIVQGGLTAEHNHFGASRKFGKKSIAPIKIFFRKQMGKMAMLKIRYPVNPGEPFWRPALAGEWIEDIYVIHLYRRIKDPDIVSQRKNALVLGKVVHLIRIDEKYQPETFFRLNRRHGKRQILQVIRPALPTVASPLND
ncbi:MAG: hypothetical protein ACK5JO_16270 [Halodesulfovibrio sp.]